MGWGQALSFFMAAPEQLQNRAVSGRSLRSFLNEGKWPSLLEEIAPGDVVLISFGHNDSRDDAPERYADPKSDYPDFLRKYIEDVRERGAKPILVSSAPRRLWEGPAMVETHGLYLQAAETVAAEKDVPLIDLARDGLAYFETIGREETKRDFLWLSQENANARFPDGVEDNTHFSELGACGMAFLIAQDLISAEELPAFIDAGQLAVSAPRDGVRPAPVLACETAKKAGRQ